MELYFLQFVSSWYGLRQLYLCLCNFTYNIAYVEWVRYVVYIAFFLNCNEQLGTFHFFLLGISVVLWCTSSWAENLWFLYTEPRSGILIRSLGLSIFLWSWHTINISFGAWQIDLGSIANCMAGILAIQTQDFYDFSQFLQADAGIIS